MDGTKLLSMMLKVKKERLYIWKLITVCFRKVKAEIKKYFYVLVRAFLIILRRKESTKKKYILRAVKKI